MKKINSILKNSAPFLEPVPMIEGEKKMVPTVSAEKKEDEFPFEEITISGLTKRYKNGDYTVEEVIQAYLDRIHQYEEKYNAFTFLNEDALKQAREIDRLLKQGNSVGKLAGVPIVIKEAIDVSGFPSTFGWKGFSKEAGGIEIIPKTDAPVVQLLKEEGAIILGKTNMPAFSGSGTRANTSWDGNTYNAVNHVFAPGGSSSGTATAVSGNFSVVGIAEETGGSIQNPAAAQALVGLKPTFGLVPNTGTTPLGGNTRDVLGPHARSVEDAAMILDIIAGYNKQDPKTKGANSYIPEGGYTSYLNAFSLKGKRLGLYGFGWRDQNLSEETQVLYARAVKEIELLGAEVIVDPFADSGFAELSKKTGDIGYDALVSDFQSYLNRMDLDEDQATITELFKQVDEIPWEAGGPLYYFQNRRANFEEGLKDPHKIPDLSTFNNTRKEYLQIIRNVMEQYNLDGFAYPQMSEAIPTLEGERIHEATTVPEINICGMPLITVPAGYYKSGSPFSLAFFGDMWSEVKLLGMAYNYEQATQYRVAPVLENSSRLTDCVSWKGR